MKYNERLASFAAPANYCQKMGDSHPLGYAVRASPSSERDLSSNDASFASAENQPIQKGEWVQSHHEASTYRKGEWFSMTGWKVYLHGHKSDDIDWLIRWADANSPISSEATLRRACDITRRMIFEAAKLCRRDSSSLSLLEDIMQLQKAYVEDDTVFNERQSNRTLRRHSENFEKILSFFFALFLPVCID